MILKKTLTAVLVGAAVTSAMATTDNIYSSASEKKLQQYMLKKAYSTNGSMTLDLSDPKQMQFVLHRLRASDNTPENSPQLYRMVKSLKTKHIKAKAKGKKTLAESSNNHTDEKAHNLFGVYIQEMEGGNKSFIHNEVSGKEVVAHARSSVEGGTEYTLVDIILYDEDYNQIGSLGAKESFAGGKHEIASSFRDYQSLASEWKSNQSNVKVSDDINGMMVIGDSMTIIKKDDGTEEVKYKTTQYFLPMPDDANGMPVQPIYNHIHPTDLNGDGTSKLCLNRNHADCDYAIDQAGQGNDQTLVRIPWQGMITLPHRIVKIYAPGETVLGIDEQTEIRVSRRDVGGTTRLENSLGKTYYDYIHVTNDEDEKVSTIEWNIPRDEGVFGNATLFARNERVDWFLNAVVEMNPYFHPRRSANALITTGTAHPSTDFAFDQGIYPLKFAYSCLARGTQIELANGKSVAIENIKMGDIVVANGLDMAVADVSIGIETIPMVRIQDENGNSVLLTESHPVIFPGRNIVWASEVQIGDLVMTEDGPSRVAMVKKEMFEDQVYNLKLKTLHGGMGSIAHDANAFYANGFLVGDLSMQANYEFKHLDASSDEDVLRRLPKEWHEDYILSKIK